MSSDIIASGVTSPRVGWIASLSNGMTAVETEMTPGEMSSWQQLLRFLKDNNLRITMLRLQHNRQTVVADGKADGFVQCYQLIKSVFTSKETRYHGIGSVFGDLVFLTWMNGMGEVIQDVRPLSEYRVHSTMDWQAEK